MAPPPSVPALGIPGFHLRAFRPADAPAWHTIVSDPRVYEPTSWPLLTVSEIESNILTLETRPKAWRWAIACDESDELVGTCGANRCDPVAGEGEIAYELAPAVWGRGLATAAVQRCCEVLHATGFTSANAFVWSGNVASAATLARCGFSRTELLPAFRSCRGEPRDFERWVLAPLR